MRALPALFSMIESGKAAACLDYASKHMGSIKRHGCCLRDASNDSFVSHTFLWLNSETSCIKNKTKQQQQQQQNNPPKKPKPYNSVKDYLLWICLGKKANWDKNKLHSDLNKITYFKQILVSWTARAFCFALRCRRYWRQRCVQIFGSTGLMVRISQCIAVIVMRSGSHSCEG